MMPDMDGYLVCIKLKELETVRDIPVLFISALSETFDIVKAFQCGGVDYILKPFQAPEVLARIKIQLELQRTRQDLQSLLSKTLIGSVRMMIDLLSVTHPTLMAQSGRIRRYARELIQQLKINPHEAWNIELAVLLAPVGSLRISAEELRRRDTKPIQGFEELRQQAEAPAMGAAMVGRIPRLEKVAAIIYNQSIPIHLMAKAETDITYVGSAMLHLLLAFDTLISSGKEPAEAVQALGTQFYPIAMLEGLRLIVAADNCLTPLRLTFGLLQPGMVLAEDLVGYDGSVVMGNGSELSASLIQLLHNFAAQGNCHSKQILVWDPSSIEHHMPPPQTDNSSVHAGQRREDA